MYEGKIRQKSSTNKIQTYSNVTPKKKKFKSVHKDIFQILQTKFKTVSDSFSKYGQAYTLEPILSSLKVMNALFIFILQLDNTTEFGSQVFSDFCKLYKIHLQFRTPRNFNINSPVNVFSF